LLRVDKDIARLPLGFDTPLSGNQEDAIPPGLKQRLAMVRALALRPRIILFNNADKSLDRAGYNIVHSLLARVKGKATLILVSDDENIRALADRYFMLSQTDMKETEQRKDALQPFTLKELDL